ncbi:hypothetical protein bcgnr5378_06690 [Bacillus cereus]|uniref:Uncharacterized protein n=1 Tax=Bacillus cereus TaxID=1396 RepID=A0A164L9F1_BACCE|nr:hypothetical protein [Bacillus cereus]KZD55570.1 hypothetical protein B4088_5315 [Bacillus cereus]
MNVNTKQIFEGVLTVEGNPVNIGMSCSELERILNENITVDSDFVGYVLGSELLVEDEKPVSFTVHFKNDTVSNLAINIGGFRDDDAAYEYLMEWLKERKIREWIGDSYYKTEFGSINASLLRDFTGYFAIKISLEYKEVPSRKFPSLKENKNNTVKFVVDSSEYKVQRIPLKELDNQPFLYNFIGDGPMSIHERIDTHSKDDRIETIYFMISKIENGMDTVIGVSEFTYFAVWEAYQNSELFICLDGSAESWGFLGFVCEKYGVGLQDNKGITPYILLFETIHDEVPHNKELKVFEENKNNMKLLYNSALRLTSEYVKIPEKDMTLISLSENKDNLFSGYKKVKDIYLNYQRTEQIY